MIIYHKLFIYDRYACEVDELTAGGCYYFRVLAENQKGLSEACELGAPVRVEREVEAPSRPHDLRVVRQGRANAVVLEWQAPMYDGNESVREYVVEEWKSSGRDR